MRKLILSSLVALPLAGCQTAATDIPYSPIISSIIGVVPEQVQSYAVAACGYLPTAQTVASLIAAWTGKQVPDIAQQIALEICSVVLAPKPAGRSRSVVVLHGVPVTGAFVR